MAFVHGTGGVFSLDVSDSLVDMSPYVESFNIDFTREIADVKAMGDSWVERLAGMRICDCSGEAAYDTTLDSALWTAWTADTALSWQFELSGVTYSGECRVTGFSINASSTDAVRQPFTLVNDGAVTRV